MNHIFDPERGIFTFAKSVDVFGQFVQPGGSRNFALFFQQIRSHPAPVLLLLLNDLFRVQRFNVDGYRQILNIVSQQAVTGERRQIAFREIVQSEDIVEIAVRVKTRRTGFGRSFPIAATVDPGEIRLKIRFVIDIQIERRFIDRAVVFLVQSDVIQRSYRLIQKLLQFRPVRLKSCDDFALELSPVLFLFRYEIRTDKLTQLPAEIYGNILPVQSAFRNPPHEIIIILRADFPAPEIGGILLRVLFVPFQNIPVVRIPRIADLDALVEALRGQPAGQAHEQIVLQRIPGIMQIRNLQPETLAGKSL